jgi:7,8-dihydropterin-6-yl-methyl-4-(beta-D-ribofuranosyl)aminobenzene 5'-phosphate synthase
MNLRCNPVLFFCMSLVILCCCGAPPSEEPVDSRFQEELAFVEQARAGDPDLDKLIDELGGTGALPDLMTRFEEGKKKAEEEWRDGQASLAKIENLESTKTLEILPLVDWFTSSEDLKGEVGVSYLVKTDENTILFDVGWNEKEDDPSPLQYNMDRLGVIVDDIDTIVISHNHGDHVGGNAWSKANTFSLGLKQIDLGDKRVYTPVPMTYPGLEPIYSSDPTVIAKGVATSGTIENEFFAVGRVPEQALVVHVEGKGIVVISGCGHQTLPKMLERAEALVDEPVYGIVGGLHYPVTDSREFWKGIKIQKYMVTGKLPWRFITLDEVRQNIEFLKARDPSTVHLSAHDSCDATIEAFRGAFHEAFHVVEVGKRIVIG